MLLLSRADQRSFTRDHVDLSLIAEEATETLLPLAEQRGVTIETSGDVTPTIGSHALLLQLTHEPRAQRDRPQPARARHRVGHDRRSTPKRVVLTVENTGEKLTPQSVSTLAEPFQRGTERIRTDHAGVGLGLAIVKSITQAHDGTLTLTPRAAGGLCVTVQLPPRRRTAADEDCALQFDHPSRGLPTKSADWTIRPIWGDSARLRRGLLTTLSRPRSVFPTSHGGMLE